MSVGDLVDAVLADCEALPVRDLHAVGEWVDEHAVPTLHQLAEQTARAELPEAVAMFGHAREALDQALQLLDSAARTLRAYCERKTGSASTGSPPALVQRAATPDHRLTRQERFNRLEVARRKLAPPTPGARTHGAWVDERGNQHELGQRQPGRMVCRSR